MTTLQPRDFVAYVEGRGYRAVPITNTTAVALDGVDLAIVGYELRGPRGNKTVVGKRPDGTLPKFDADLWCDCVDYASARIKEQRR